ncbi:MAG: hypothetical protein JSS30_06260 [Verrucomicrobia bacterium]|nr:hypothetical protein [Verrucomicrobiota bacterium]
MKRQLQNSGAQQNRPFEPFCHPTPEPYSTRVCAREPGLGPSAAGKLAQNHRFFWGPGVLQFPLKIALLLLPVLLSAAEISSKKATYDGNALILNGDVQVDHGLGKLASGSARLEKEEKDGPFSSIALREDVLITLKNLGKISCATADLNFVAMKGKLLPEVGKLIKFVNQGPDHFTLASCQADLEFTKEGESYKVHKIDADGQVQVEYGADFKLDADHATYVNEATPHITAMPGCVLTHHDDRIEAEKVELFPNTATAVLMGPKGVLNPRGMTFSCKKMTWENEPQQLTLQGNVTVRDTELGTLHCDDEVELNQKQLDGKWVLSSMVANGKTELTTRFKQLLICYGQMRLDQERQLLTLESPQHRPIEYLHDQMKLCSDYAQLEYSTEYDPEKLELSGNVQLQIEETGSRCARADQFIYFPNEEKMILSSKTGGNVLFWDKNQDLSISAREVHIARVDQKEIIKGVGSVRFAFSTTENELLQKLFPFYKGDGE